MAAAALLRLLRSLGVGRFCRASGGNIAVAGALALPVVIGALALAVDYGTLTLERREAQGHVDLAAILAASRLDDPHEAVRRYVAANGLDLVVAVPDGYLAGDGKVTDSVPDGMGVLEIETGRYRPDAALARAERFVAGAAPADAARVALTDRGTLHFAASFASPPEIHVTAMASATARASFSIGSRLLGVGPGLLNSMLSGLIGTEISLSAMDYDALLDADIDLLKMFDLLAGELDLTAATYDELLDEEVSLGAVTKALGGLDLEGPVDRALDLLAKQTSASDAILPLHRLFDAGPIGELAIGRDPNLDVKASALQLITAAARLADGERQAAISISQDIGLAALTLDVAIGEPPVGSSWIAVGEKGDLVRTAQTRIALAARTELTLLLIRVAVNLPIYVEIAHAEARLADVTCSLDGRATVALDARPGIVEAAIGEVTPQSFDDFSRSPTVEPAVLAEVSGIRILASAHVESTQMAPHRVTFSANEIAEGTVQTVVNEDLLQSLVVSLVDRLELSLQPDPLFLGGLVELVLNALRPLLVTIAAPLDDLLAELLATLGIELGAADLRVTGAECGRAYLVQ